MLNGETRGIVLVLFGIPNMQVFYAYVITNFVANRMGKKSVNRSNLPLYFDQ